MTTDRDPGDETDKPRLSPEEIADELEQLAALYAAALTPALCAQKLRLMAKDIEAAGGRPN